MKNITWVQLTAACFGLGVAFLGNIVSDRFGLSFGDPGDGEVATSATIIAACVMFWAWELIKDNRKWRKRKDD